MILDRKRVFPQIPQQLHTTGGEYWLCAYVNPGLGSLRKQVRFRASQGPAARGAVSGDLFAELALRHDASPSARDFCQPGVLVRELRGEPKLVGAAARGSGAAGAHDVQRFGVAPRRRRFPTRPGLRLGSTRPRPDPRAIEFSVQSVFPARVNAAGDAWVSNLDNRDGK